MASNSVGHLAAWLVARSDGQQLSWPPGSLTGRPVRWPATQLATWQP